MDLGEHGIRAHCDITKGREQMQEVKNGLTSSLIMLLENIVKVNFA